MTTPSFNLIDQPWTLAHRLDGCEVELSLHDTFHELGDLRGLAGELPTQVLALNRLLLAIVYRAVDPFEDDWVQMWRDQRLPLDRIDAYLERHRERFDLLHPDTPFFQVADLHTAKGEFTSVTRLIADAPALDRPHFSTRWGEALESLSFAEAARWVVHCHAFDVSGIKSGAVGDDRVKGGKGYPIGMGAAGHLGGILLEGDTALQTLLLNLVPQDDGDLDQDLPPWERPPDGARPAFREVNGRAHQPAGRAELFTWQTRRVRLVHDGECVRQVLLCNGDRFSSVNLHRVESMTAWRDSPTQARKLGVDEAKMPRTHVPGRASWRGLASLLADDVPHGALPPATHAWVGRQTERGAVDAATLVRARALGMEYINNSSNTGDVIDDELALPVRVLQQERCDLRVAVRDAVEDTHRAVYAFTQLVTNLARAAGDDTETSALRDGAQTEAYGRLDLPFREWLGRLRDPSVDAATAIRGWGEQARRDLLELSDARVEAAGPAAWVGRRVDDRHLSASRAEMWFRTQLFKIFPAVRQETSS